MQSPHRQKAPRILNQLLQLQQQQKFNSKQQLQRKISVKRIQALNRFIHIDEKDQYLIQQQQEKQQQVEELYWTPKKVGNSGSHGERSTTDKEVGAQYEGLVNSVEKIGKTVSNTERVINLAQDHGIHNKSNISGSGSILKQGSIQSQKYYSYVQNYQNPEVSSWSPVNKNNSTYAYEYSFQSNIKQSIPQNKQTPLFSQPSPQPQPPLQIKPSFPMSPSHTSYQPHPSPPSSCLPFSLQSYCETCDLFTNTKMLGQHICYAKLNNKTNIQNALHRIQVMIGSNGLTELCVFPEMIKKSHRVDELKLVLKMLGEKRKCATDGYMEIVGYRRLINVCEKKINLLSIQK